MVELSLRNIKKSYGINEILKDVNFEAKTRERIGIVGENGAGKTTIFRIIKNMEEPDGGKIDTIFKDSIGYLEQIPIYKDEKTVEMVLKEAYKKVEQLENEISKVQEKMKTLEGGELERILKQYDKLILEFEALDGYNREINYNKICNGLGFKKDFLEKNFSLLSGGEKTIVLLGKTLLENNRILLLDEPTNHLDIEMVTWLEEYVKEYKGTILIISHDRYFLDKVANKIVEIEDGEAKTYLGNYSTYKKIKEEEIQRQYELYKTQQKKIAAMKAAIQRLKDFGQACHSDKNPFYKRAFNMEKRLEKMEKVEKVKEKSKLKINAEVGERSANNIVLIENVSKSFNDKVILDRANGIVNHKDRVALIGNNGAGKTTFIKMLLGEENIDSGKLSLGANVEVAYLEQNIKFSNDKLTILEYIRENENLEEAEARKYLAKFLFFQDEVFKCINKLSGGEKSRLRLAKMLLKPNNLLILDEPTNHLDIDAREQIEEVLLEYKGTVFFISHDRYFINKIATKIIELENHKLNEYLGDYNYYLEIKNRNKQLIQESKVKEKKEKNINESYEIRKKQKSINTEIRKLETNIKKIEAQIEDIDREMQENISNYVYLEELYTKKQNLEKQLDEFMESWILLQE